ncbi:MAG: NADH-quinone oxidoreductase subunit I [Phycisphaerae bacterium]|nr:NADH-quinone oxidoreductase subunit I [Phycisphaerae bacterium]
MRDYLYNVWSAFSSILIGLGVTLKYCFAKTITVQYPNVAPTVKPRSRGIHWLELERCIACGACTKICPVECIAVERTKPRKVDKALNVAVGGALTRYEIDYGKCLMCAMCVDACPTSCLHMGDNHDLSCYRREDCVGDFVALARDGRQTPEPLWIAGPQLPMWAEARRQAWADRAEPHREAMLRTLEGVEPPPKEGKAEKTPAKRQED